MHKKYKYFSMHCFAKNVKPKKSSKFLNIYLSFLNLCVDEIVYTSKRGNGHLRAKAEKESN